MADDLFVGLPPPSAVPPPLSQHESSKEEIHNESPSIPTPAPILKSSLKRKNPPEIQNQETQAPSQKGVRFKTTVEASDTQVIDAMQRVASHIKNPTKFNKASKLAVQLIEAGSVKPETSDYFFSILEAAMSSPTACTSPSVRADYHTLFTASQNVADLFTKKQKNQLSTWNIMAVVGNDLHTDDSFVFSKAAGRIKEIISNLRVATKDDDMEEAENLKDENNTLVADTQNQETASSAGMVQSNEKAEHDPFGLDALLSGPSNTDERPKAVERSKKADEEESKRFLRAQREALIFCLEIAARRYKVPWCQTVIDILVKHAFDNIDRFTSQQRLAIQKLWASIHEQQTRRKQGRSVTGKLDMNGFEWLQQKYSTEKMSIRHSVGGSTRRAEQWLG